MILATVPVGCLRSSDQDEIVLYTALDQEFSEPIIKDFSAKTGVKVRTKYDAEARKSVGLTKLIENERNRPRCDLFWNNEILNTLLLDEQGLLESYHPSIADKYPIHHRSPKGTWHGFAARARVILVNTELVSDEEMPTSILDLANPRWKGKVGIAKMYGTTRTHAACLFAYWGEEKAKKYFHDVKANARLMPGNKQVAKAVSGKQLAFGLTDTDDSMIEIEQGMPVKIVYPDQEPDQMGTLFIPNTLALIRGASNHGAARRLVDHLLSPATEKRLAEGRSAQIPLNPDVKADVRVATPATIKAMQVDFHEAAASWHSAAEFLLSEFAGDP